MVHMATHPTPQPTGLESGAASAADQAIEHYMALGFTREEACERVIKVAFEAALAAIKSLR